MSTPETSREPCPDRIVDDLGGSFAMGVVGGSFYHLIKGIYNSPKGERLIGGTQAVRMNAPRLGGSFAAWGGIFSVFDCSMVYVRQKEDPWNSIYAGAAAGGFLQMRAGLGSASRSALMGGCLLALIEGAGIMMNKVLLRRQQIDDPMVQNMPAGFPMGQLPNQAPSAQMVMPSEEKSASSSSSWFGGMFGGGKEEKSGGGGGSKTEVLESFDSPSTPIPSFEYK